jgi:RNA polymerase sigma-70 factor (ECF subfamily)
MLKKRDRENGELDVHCESPDFSPLQMLEQQDENALFMRIIEQLPFLQQSVVRMKHINGLETEEIAEITGCSQEAVRMNLSRARKKIKELYFSINK